MAYTSTKNKKSDKYKYVQVEYKNEKTYYRLWMNGYTKKCYKTEREAAIAADKILIEQGKEPVNILVRK